MSTTSAARDDQDVFDLHQRFLKLLSLTTQPQRAELAWELIVHPASRRRMHIACANVFQKAAFRQDLREDAMQEASCLLIRRLESAALRFRDEGPSRFGGWLYTLWRNALREAWRLLHAQERRAMPTMTTDQLARVAQAGHRDNLADDRAQRVYMIIHQIEDLVLHHVMSDWAAGLSGVESARLRNLSPSAVSKRRAQGLELITRQLQQMKRAG